MIFTRKHRRLAPEISRALRILRRRIRSYALYEGVAAIIVLLTAGFWIGFALDWTFEPSRSVRIAAAVVVAVVVAAAFYWYVLRRIFVRLRPASLALLLERRNRQLQDRVLTAVELRSRKPTGLQLAMLEETEQAAREHMQSIDPVDVLNPRPVVRKSLWALALVASIVVFGWTSESAFATFVQRLQLNDVLYPRLVELTVDEFPAGGSNVVRVPRDASFELNVRASLNREHIAPDEVEIRYRTAAGDRGRDSFTRVGNALTRYQLYRYEIKNVTQDLEFDIVGGDDAIRGLKIEVVQRPRIVDLKVRCEYPEYTGKPAETREIAGPLQLPEGTALTLTGRSTKDLQAVHLHDVLSGDDTAEHFSDASAIRSFEFAIDTLTADRVILLSVTDTDDVPMRDPIRISLTMVADEPPQVAVRTNGIGNSVTVNARLPFVGVIEDPRYGAQEAWFETTIGQEEAARKPLAAHPNGAVEFPVDATLDLREIDPDTQSRRLAVEPGQRLIVQLKASDKYDLSNVPHVGNSQAFEFDVVTDQQLHAILEQRELSLRQRFESIFDKMQQTRGLLARIELEDEPDAADTASDGDATAQQDDEVAEEENPKLAQTRRELRVAGALQNVMQSAHETLGVADGFDEIQLEFVNNRLDATETLERLRDSVASPLRNLGETSMPELAKRLETLQQAIVQRKATPRGRDEAIAQTDVVIEAMQQILDKMRELENYNEVLDLLRKLIQRQDELIKRTQQRQRESLRDLLE